MTRRGSRPRTRWTRSGATGTSSSPAAPQIEAFLERKWSRELEYALRKDLWAFGPDRIAVRFQYESRDVHGDWWRSYGNELWEFAPSGLMRRREASINDIRIDEGDRRIMGPRSTGNETALPLG